MRNAGTSITFALALLGCPSDDVPSGDASTSRGSAGEGTVVTSSVSATGMLPPPQTTSDSGTGADSTSSTTAAESSGTTNGGDIGEPDDGPVCNQCCGNGVIDGTEQCDCGQRFCTPAGLGFAECADLVNPLFPERVYTGGVIDCTPATCQFRFNLCTWCGDGVITGAETCEPDPPPLDTCASLGLGDAIEPLPCSESCQLDTSSCV